MRHPHRREWLAYQINGHGLRSVAELGVRDGRTFIYLANQCPNLISLLGVDTWGLNGIGPPDWPHETNLKKVRHACRGFPYVRLIRDTTERAAEEIPDRSLDLVFIDADHTTPAVESDIRRWLSKIRPGGLLCGDDYHWPSVSKAVHFVLGAENISTAPDGLIEGKLWYLWLSG